MSEKRDIAKDRERYERVVAHPCYSVCITEGEPVTQDNSAVLVDIHRCIEALPHYLDRTEAAEKRVVELEEMVDRLERDKIDLDAERWHALVMVDVAIDEFNQWELCPNGIERADQEHCPHADSAGYLPPEGVCRGCWFDYLDKKAEEAEKKDE